MTFWTFLFCCAVFYIGWGGRVLSGIDNGEWDEDTEERKDKRSSGPRKGELREHFKEDPGEALAMVALCLFGWPIVLTILYD